MDAPDIRLVPLPQLTRGPRWRVEAARSYAADQLLWITRGQGKILLAGRMAGFGAQNAIFIPADTMHAFELGPPIYGLAVFLGPGHGVSLPELPVRMRVRDSRRQSELSAALDALQHEIDGDAPGRSRALAAQITLLGVWLERRRPEELAGGARESRAQLLARRFAALVEDRFTSEWSVADYAAALNVTPTHLTRVCRETAGRTASELLTARKMAEARRLLADTRLPVKEIAAGLGFGSAAYFTRCFQARTGAAPTEFRRGD